MTLPSLPSPPSPPSPPALGSDAAELARDADWRRLDGRMLLVHPVNEVIRFLPVLVGVSFVGSHSTEGLLWHLVALAAPIAVGLLRFVTTRFRITPTQLELRRGLVSRNVLTARLDRVRTVELTSSVIHRALGLAKVHIGTGSAAKEGHEKFVLDALGVREARTLRHALLHRSPGSVPDAETEAAPDELLVRFDPAWVRFAPLTTGGLAIGIGALVAGNQLIGPVADRLAHRVHIDRHQHLPLTIAVAVVAFVALISVLSVVGYLLTNWSFTLTRDPAGRSLHVRKGMLTTRETSLELDRVRGLEVHEPLGLRLAGGARLAAGVTGLTRRESGSTALVPPAPARVVAATARLVSEEPEAVTMPLETHGPAATRRRYTRALTVAAVLDALGLGVVLANGWPAIALALLGVPLALALVLGRDRARRLGHALTPHYLVSRGNSFHGRRVLLDRDGLIGFNLHESYFQRRAGLVTVTATTAAGRHGYALHDVPRDRAVRLAAEAVPGLLADFLVDEPSDQATVER